MNPTTRTASTIPNVTVRVVPDLPNPAELTWYSDGDVTLNLSPRGAFPGNLVQLFRWAADELEQRLTPDSSGYRGKPRLSLVPTQRDGGQS